MTSQKPWELVVELTSHGNLQSKCHISPWLQTEGFSRLNDNKL